MNRRYKLVVNELNNKEHSIKFFDFKSGKLTDKISLPDLDYKILEISDNDILTVSKVISYYNKLLYDISFFPFSSVHQKKKVLKTIQEEIKFLNQDIKFAFKISYKYNNKKCNIDFCDNLNSVLTYFTDCFKWNNEFEDKYIAKDDKVYQKLFELFVKYFERFIWFQDEVFNSKYINNYIKKILKRLVCNTDGYDYNVSELREKLSEYKNLRGLIQFISKLDPDMLKEIKELISENIDFEQKCEDYANAMQELYEQGYDLKDFLDHKDEIDVFPDGVGRLIYGKKY